MALRDRQISGIPLTKMQSEIISHLMTVLVPVLGYKVWYPLLGVPQELWLVLAIISTAIHLGMSAQIVPNNVERNLLWFGSYTGESFSNGICFIPRLPFPIVLLVIRVMFGEEIYKKILWSLEGDVSIQSIFISFVAEGLARDEKRVRMPGTIRFEVFNAATYRSQTMEDGGERLNALIAAEYANGVKLSVISQHTTAELMQGYHSAGSQALIEWMNDQWKLEQIYGGRIMSVQIPAVEILSKDVEHAFDLERGKETFVAAAGTVAEIIAELKRKHPNLTDTEIALMYPSILRDTGNVNVNIHNVKFK